MLTMRKGFNAPVRRGGVAATGMIGALLACAAVMPLTSAGAESAAVADILGFSAADAAAETKLESRFDSDLSAADLRSWMEQMSSGPNNVGAVHDRANAEFQLQKFREWGWDASIETFSVLYPTPREISVELVAPTHFVARLTEPPIAGDRTSFKTKDELPAYNVYGADGDVTALLVYVNQGMPEDYKELERQGVSVKGRIVLTRYGGGWRGLKPKLAYEHGAVGCLIYSDPRDDGYPKGGYRPRDGVQRGSVQDLVLYTGDPLTPGVGATPGAKRLAIRDAKTVLKIPVLPLSYAAAEPLLAALGGRVAPARWRGGLPLTYHMGPGPAKVHLKVLSDWSQKTLYDVIAVMHGAEEPDRWIVRGNHHDGWVFGAADPLAGQVALMAEARSIGKLVKEGWRPRRTLVYASWDGEEPGLLGSTEWVEQHAAELKTKAALYINSDMNGRGFLGVGGSAGLQRFASEAARDVKDPETGASVLVRAVANDRVGNYESGIHANPGRRGNSKGHVDAGGDLQLEALGSGSDFTPFLQHLGVNSMNVEFEGETDYGVYHSAYDSFDHFRRFVDPTFEYGVALAKVVGRLTLRASQARLLPARESDFAASVAVYDDELHRLADGMRVKNEELSQLLDDGAYGLASDPEKPRAAPPRTAEVPYLNFAELDNAIAKLGQSANAFDKEYARLASLDDAGANASRERLNATLTQLEQSLTDPRGLPGREWYQHMLYAPGIHPGYGVKTLPGIREAIEERHWDEANQYIGVVSRALNAYSVQLDRAISVP
jgi:N-acetylated-alpha-linked acidic dipeptidase